MNPNRFCLKHILEKNPPKIKKKERKIYQTPLQKSNTKQKPSAATPASRYVNMLNLWLHHNLI